MSPKYHMSASPKGIKLASSKASMKVSEAAQRTEIILRSQRDENHEAKVICQNVHFTLLAVCYVNR